MCTSWHSRWHLLRLRLNLEWLVKEGGACELPFCYKANQYDTLLINQHTRPARARVCPVPCHAVLFVLASLKFTVFSLSTRSGKIIIHGLLSHHITDFIWMSSHYWEDLSMWQACSSQHWRGLVSLWEGHESSEVHHLIRKEMCHEMEVITRCF